jgi:probable O-glycosylation ligase (exosortase A-associated)
MRDIFVTAIVFGVLPFVFSRPYVGLYLYSWLSYMNPHRLAWGFASTMPFAYIVAVSTLLGVLFSKEPKRMPWTREMTVLALLILWMVMTTFFAFFSNLAWNQLEEVLKIQLMIFLTPLVINNRQRLHGLVWIIVLSLGFYGVKGGIFTILKGGAYRVQGPEGSFIAGNNEIALALLMIVPLIRYLQLQEKRKWLHLGLGGAMILTTLAAIGSQSRGALVGAAAMGTIFWFKSRNKFFSAIMIVVAVGLVAAIMPQEWYDRMSTIKTPEQDLSAQGRINAWWTAWNVVKDRPLTGGGFQMFQAPIFEIYAPDPDNVHDVHSVYFEMLGEHGFIGLGLWLLLACLTWFTGSWVIRNAKRDPEKRWAADLAAMGQVSMIGYLAAGAFLGLAYFDLYYHIIMIIVLAKVISLKEEKEKIAGSEPIQQHMAKTGSNLRRALRKKLAR